ncbi:MAG: 1,4-dihydroxy-2-naphthoate octaprenyltransferase [Muribaculaceae bacterium]|nr:1,4-dihydroxy-2-naphthoate octaprenyltransferase [Muribaculaceae bacterium]MBR1475588.1 1,4-dihydroxy-2-naphthoate octaprenyltransferase [Muribaculaceae bacterium]
MRELKIWIECMRLRTLPVSLSGVVIACALAWWAHRFAAVPAMLCLAFALLAQVASNFANEYYDFKHGADKVGRVGPRRGVTEGDIRPRTLLIATFSTLAAAGIVGCCLIPYGGWWLLPVGVLIGVGALAYSTGPYPLSYHGLGELAVFFFFGVIPVTLTYYVQALRFDPLVLLASMSTGLLGVNVLLVNNYRDVDDDREAGKRTSVVIFGREPAAAAYLINGYVAMCLLTPLWVRAALGLAVPVWTLLAPVIYLSLHTVSWWQLRHRDGSALNPLLGSTARNMLIFTLLLSVCLVL